MKPYIGVTGFMTRNEVQEVLSLLPKGFKECFYLMVGVLVSNKTLNGGTNSYPFKYPMIEDVTRIFLNRSDVLNLIHYSTDYPDKLLVDMLRLMELGGDNCHGIQLNVTWPKTDIIRSFRESFPITKLVLQCSPKSMEEVGNNPDVFAERLSSYKGLVDHILIDSSGGRGIEMDIEKTISCINVIKDMGFSIGVAGGLGPDNIELILGDVIGGYHNAFNIDAEGRLRNENGSFNIEKAVYYVSRAYEYFTNL